MAESVEMAERIEQEAFVLSRTVTTQRTVWLEGLVLQ